MGETVLGGNRISVGISEYFRVVELVFQTSSEIHYFPGLQVFLETADSDIHSQPQQNSTGQQDQ